ncbi:MAG: site-2 protease family protein [Calditrichia bacterium]
MENKQIEEIGQLVGPAFKPDLSAYSKGHFLFRAGEEDLRTWEIDNVTERLLEKGYYPHVEQRNGEYFLFVHPRRRKKKPLPLWFNGLLFVVAIFTTMAAGALLRGGDIYQDFSSILLGWKYSFAVITILTFHEMGHYVAARWHKIRATLPYYIPFFIPGFFNIGTMGAVIRIKSQFPDRKALLDVGIAGPLAGFVMSLVFLFYGYATLPDMNGIIAYVETIHPWDIGNEGVNLILGKSILFSFFNDFIGSSRLPMNEVYHFPYIFAGWIGLLVTAINLIPIGQLDGGHILFALMGRRARRVGLITFLAMFALNMYLVFEYMSFIWMLWILLILILIRFRHPPTLDDSVELTPIRRYLGWLCMIIFTICFIPNPIYIQ